MPKEYAELVVAVNTDSAVKAKQDMDNLIPTTKEVDRATNDVRKTIDKTTAAVDKHRKSTTENTKAIDKTVKKVREADKTAEAFRKETQKLSMALEEQKKVSDRLSTEVQKASTAISKQEAEIERLTKALNKNNSAGKKAVQVQDTTTKSFRVQKGAVQGTAFQLQDLAVQIQGGTKASRALSQQLPQMLGYFGAGGAILGLFASLGAVAFAPLIDGLSKAKKEADKLSNAVDELGKRASINSDGVLVLSKSIRELHKSSKAAAELEVQIGMAQANIAIKSATAGIKSSLKEIITEFNTAAHLASLGNAAWAGSLTKVEKKYGLTREQAKEFGKVAKTAMLKPTVENISALQKLSSKLDLSNEKFLKFTSSLNESFYTLVTSKELLLKLGKAAEDVPSVINQGKVKKETEALARQEEALEMLFLAEEKARAAKAKRDADAVKAENKGISSKVTGLEFSLASPDDRLEKQFEDRQTLLESAKERELITVQKYDQLMLDSKEQYNEATKKLDAGRAAALSGFMGQSAAILEQGFGKQNAITKLAFAAQKLLAIPQMIVATETGAAQALALGPIAGPPLAALVKGLGYASIGAVVGTTLAGRAQGGQVRPGEAYRVGEYGPETLVMGSNGGFITPKGGGNGGGQPVQVVNNVKVIGGSGNQEVTTTSRQVSDVKFVQDIVVREMTNPSSRGRTGMGSNSNLVNKGTR